MKNKLLICITLGVILLCGCGAIENNSEKDKSEPILKEDVMVISDITYNKKNDFEPIIYLKEKEEYRPYIVVTDDYNGKTLLVSYL